LREEKKKHNLYQLQKGPSNPILVEYACIVPSLRCINKKRNSKRYRRVKAESIAITTYGFIWGLFTLFIPDQFLLNNKKIYL